MKTKEEIVKIFHNNFYGRLNMYSEIYDFILTVIDELTKKEYCEWKEDDIDGGWDTQCENKHLFIEGTPKQNDYKFCPYCEKEIKQI